MKLAGIATLPLAGIMAGSIPAAGSPTRLFHLAAAAWPWMNGCHFPSIYPSVFTIISNSSFFPSYSFLFSPVVQLNGRRFIIHLRGRYFSYFAWSLPLFVASDFCCVLMGWCRSLTSNYNSIYGWFHWHHRLRAATREVRRNPIDSMRQITDWWIDSLESTFC